MRIISKSPDALSMKLMEYARVSHMLFMNNKITKQEMDKRFSLIYCHISELKKVDVIV